MSGFGSRGGFGRRGGDDYDNDGGHYDMYVPARDCGKIIGRGGSKIRDLQDESGCKIKVSRDDEGDGTRKVELQGSEDSIERAKDLINSVLEGGDDRDNRGGGGGGGGFNQGGGFGGGSGGSKEVMQVDSSFVGRIIGKGGSRIRELQDETGCRINVSRDGGNYGSTDVELLGSRAQIQRARDAIEDITSQQGY